MPSQSISLYHFYCLLFQTAALIQCKAVYHLISHHTTSIYLSGFHLISAFLHALTLVRLGHPQVTQQYFGSYSHRKTELL